MQFKNRAQAARLLADGLAGYRGSNPLVLAIPRGAVPMAHIIAERLGGEFDVVLVRKLGAPGNRRARRAGHDEQLIRARQRHAVPHHRCRIR